MAYETQTIAKGSWSAFIISDDLPTPSMGDYLKDYEYSAGTDLKKSIPRQAGEPRSNWP